MNTKAAFAVVGEWVSGLTGMLAGFVALSVLGEIILGSPLFGVSVVSNLITLVGLVSVGVLSQVVFGTGWLGIDVVGNISGLVNSFIGGGLTGIVTLIVLLSLWDNK
jgi:hypothetical protein